VPGARRTRRRRKRRKRRQEEEEMGRIYDSDEIYI